MICHTTDTAGLWSDDDPDIADCLTWLKTGELVYAFADDDFDWHHRLFVRAISSCGKMGWIRTCLLEVEDA